MFAFKASAIALGAIVLLQFVPSSSTSSHAGSHSGRNSASQLGTPAQAMTPYGTGDGLTLQQSRILQRRQIAFPQSYRAMVNRFGYPDFRDSRADYYRMIDGRLVTIVYSGRSAVAMEGL